MASTVSDGQAETGGWRRFVPTYERTAPGAHELAAMIATSPEARGRALSEAAQAELARRPRRRKYAAILLLLRDLTALGWEMRAVGHELWVRPHANAVPTREIARRQLQHGRVDQFAEAGTRAFIEEMERPGSGRSIVNLFADGRRLATTLRQIAALPRARRADALRNECRPYVQVAALDATDGVTGASLFHVWRYLRLTWASRYRRVPGRQLAFLIRDGARPNHPVMAIAALSSPVLQLTPRDDWAGWSPNGLVRVIESGICTDAEALAALRSRVRADIQAIYAADLGYDAADPPLLTSPLERKLERVAISAGAARAKQLVRGKVSKTVPMDVLGLQRQARTPLFRGKRAAAALSLLRAHSALGRWGGTVRDALRDDETRRALGIALRHAKQHATAASIMDITTCGAVPPYGPLLGGKLACLMMLTPFVRRAVREAYDGEPSIIASQMAGRVISRPATLTMLTTSSLYGERSSQYNRVRLPANTLHGQQAEIAYEEVGRSVGHGAAHLSLETEAALAEVAGVRGGFRNVNFLFGEGQSPKMRQLREATADLGLGSADILRHDSPRIVYVAPLSPAPQRVLLGIDPVPELDQDHDDGVDRVAEFWRTRWLASRVEHAPALQTVAKMSRASMAISREIEEDTATGWLSDDFR